MILKAGQVEAFGPAQEVMTHLAQANQRAAASQPTELRPRVGGALWG
jgi:ABC-type protease/lipase transport system fused ATPase/permease subunit